MTEQRLFLFDALSLIYHAYHTCSAKRKKNQNESAHITANCFFEMLHNVIVIEKPTHLAVVFDIKSPTFRHALYPKYKAHRRAMPSDITKAIDIIKNELRCIQIQSIELEGY